MRQSKNKKHERTMVRQTNKAYRKSHSLTSRSTKNRRARNIMEEINIPYIIIDGVVCTYFILIL